MKLSQFVKEKKPAFVIALFVLVVIFGFYFIRMRGGLVHVPPNDNLNLNTISLATYTDKKYSVDKDGFSIDITYPEYVESNPLFAIANSNIRIFLKRQIDTFLNEDINILDGTGRKSLSGGYTVLTSEKGIIPIVFDFAIDSPSNTHDVTYSRTLMLSDTDGKEIFVGNLFKPSSLFWRDISKLSQKYLKQKLVEDYDQDMSDDGAGPDPENFQNVYLVKEGISVSFDPYQVAPYSLGKIDIIIPYKDMENDLLPRYLSK